MNDTFRQLFSGLDDQQIVEMVVQSVNNSNTFPKDGLPITGEIDQSSRKVVFKNKYNSVDFHLKYLRERRWDILMRSLEILEANTGREIEEERTASIQPYDRILGVPADWYYLTRVINFSDFEVPFKDEILFVCPSKHALIQMCVEKRWYCSDHNPHDESWLVYGISQHK